MKSVEFKGRDFTGLIETLETEELPSKKGKQVKGIVGFRNVQKKWVLNRTNAECLRALFGRDTNGWLNHWVTLYPAQTEDGLAIRVKGSPELKQPLVFALELPFKAPRKVKLIPTGKNAKAPTPTPAPAPEPTHDEAPSPPDDESETPPFDDTEAA
jgi:hypothetical protein